VQLSGLFVARFDIRSPHSVQHVTTHIYEKRHRGLARSKFVENKHETHQMLDISAAVASDSKIATRR
ncbi:MAG: hypothetical protein ACRECY_20235, partial [Phyllobacterium sp.]